MAYDARTFQILIASPSDVDEMRDFAVKVIQDWNNLHSEIKGVVLLPLRWETHIAPAYNVRPQEEINRNIVDNCDLVVGIFWSRIGSPTGKAESGTLEEVERAAKAGKPVMLYFSNAGIPPEDIDTTQIDRLMRFQKEIKQIAIVESFKTGVEFVDKFSSHLERRVRELREAEAAQEPTPIRLQIRVPGLVEPGGEIDSTVYAIKISDCETALESKELKPHREKLESTISQRIKAYAMCRVVVDVCNVGVVGIRNVFGEIRVLGNRDDFEVLLPWSNKMLSLSSPGTIWWPESNPDDELVDLGSDAPDRTFEWNALQPKRELHVKPHLLISAKRSTDLEIEVKLYADSFPAPVTLNATLGITVEEETLTLRELLPDLDDVLKQVSPAYSVNQLLNTYGGTVRNWRVTGQS